MIELVSGTVLVKKWNGDDFLEDALDVTDIGALATSGGSITGGLEVSGDILPSTSGSSDLGSPSLPFDIGYIKTVITQGSPGVKITSSGNYGIINTTQNNDLRILRNDSSYIQLESDQVLFNIPVNINSNLTVGGTTTTLNTEQVLVEDNILTLNSTVTGTPVLDSGFEVERGSSTNAMFLWDESEDYFIAGLSGSEQRIITNNHPSNFTLNANLNVSGSIYTPSLLRTGGSLYVGTAEANPLNLGVGGVDKWRLNSSGHLVAQFESGGGAKIVQSGTNSSIKIGGGADTDSTQGASLHLYGITNANFGSAVLAAGNNASSKIYLNVSGTSAWAVNSDGSLTPAGSQTLGSTSAHISSVYVRDVVSSGTTLDLISKSNSELRMYTNDTLRWQVGGIAGALIPGASGTYNIGESVTRVNVMYGNSIDLLNSLNQQTLTAKATHSGYTSIVLHSISSRAANAAFGFIHCHSSDGSDAEFRLQGDGNGYCDGTWAGGGADYAEYFETSTSGAIDVGKSVVLSGVSGKISEYDSQVNQASDIIGVVRPKQNCSSVVGNLPMNWHLKYLRDDFGVYILDENGERQLNPEFDPDLTYVSREHRDEWVLVGLVGQAQILTSETKNPNWKKIKDVNQGVELWLIK